MSGRSRLSYKLQWARPEDIQLSGMGESRPRMSHHTAAVAATGWLRHKTMVRLPYRMVRSSQCHNTRPGRHGAFGVGTKPGEVVDAVAGFDAHDVLFDDRPFVKVLGDVEEVWSDDLHVSRQYQQVDVAAQ